MSVVVSGIILPSDSKAFYGGSGDWELLEVELDLANLSDGSGSLETVEAITRNKGTNAIACYWDDLRFHPKDVSVHSRTYDKRQLIVTSQSDENNQISNYFYDDLNRWIQTRNYAGEISIENVYYFSRDNNNDVYDASDPKLCGNDYI